MADYQLTVTQICHAIDGYSEHDVEVFNDTVTTADTWEVVGLSGTIGVDSAYVYLRVQANGSVVVSFQMKGDTGSPSDSDALYGSQQVELDSGYVGFVDLPTDPSGEIEMSCSNNTVTVVVDLVSSFANASASSENALTTVNNRNIYSVDGLPNFSAPLGSIALCDNVAFVRTDDDNTNWQELVLIGNRGVFGGGNNGSNVDTMDYIEIAEAANAVDFGDLSAARYNPCGVSSTTLGVFAGGFISAVSDIMDTFRLAIVNGVVTDFGNLSVAREGAGACASQIRGVFGGGLVSAARSEIDYIVFASLVNAATFGDLSTARYRLAGCSSPVYGLFSGGNTGSATDLVDRVTLASAGNAADYGDLSVARHSNASCSSKTLALFAGGYNGGNKNEIDKMVIVTGGTAVDWGDLTVARYLLSSLSSQTRAIYAGGSATGNTIDQSEISTNANATDFGDLTQTRSYLRDGCSNSHGGL